MSIKRKKGNTNGTNHEIFSLSVWDMESRLKKEVTIFKT